ncbi:phage portal protein [Mycobacterium sp. WMMD1722]|uniref:phage portal protein n=1 Tax=Mycobacterium sp. WMMD1722 TaxID=3404117 RepID=UPI003BF5BA86
MNTLESLLQKIDENISCTTELDKYYRGEQPLAFLSPEAKAALGSRFGVLCSNIPRVQITSLAERLRITGFAGADIWADWIRCDMDQLSGVAHREALLLGDSYVSVWARNGRPSVAIESSRQVAVQRDPATRQVVAAVKRWADEQAQCTWAVLYLPDRIVRYRATTIGATIAGFEQVETIPNPLGVVPLVPLSNTDMLLSERGTSEIADLIPLVNAMNKVLADMLVGSEYYARPRRYATGLELEERPKLDADGLPVVDLDTGEPLMEAVSPFGEGDRMLVNEDAAGKFGSLPAADLGAYEAAVRVLTAQIMAVSALPAHFLGQLTQQPTSADALRAAEASLTARAEARQATFGRAWEQVGRLIVAVRDGVDPASVDVRVQWADAATRSVAQEADAVTKLFAAGLLPASFALAKLGYSDDEITQIRTARRQEALDGAGVDLRQIAAS